MKNNFYAKKKQLENLNELSDITSILNEAYIILGNPIAMYDTSYTLLSYTQGIVTDDPLWNELIASGTFSHESVDFFISENFVEAYAQSDIVTLLVSDKLKYNRLNAKLFDSDNVQLGDIIYLACCKPLETGDEELLTVLSEILSVKLQNSALYKNVEKVFQDTLLGRLTDGKLTDEQAAGTAVAQLYDTLKPNLYLAAVDISQYENTVTHLGYFRDIFRRLQGEYHYYIHSYYVIIIVSTDFGSLHIERDLGKLHRFFAENSLFAGISGRFDSLSELNRRYGEAINALNYGLKGKKKNNIFDYNNYKLEHFLHFSGDAACSELYNDTLSCIREYDGKNGTSLLSTLYLFLLYGKDLPAAAEAAAEKAAEMSAKLEILKDLFGIDFNNGDVLCSLLMSIKILYYNQES